MAVYERTYKRYSGEMTAPWSRFLVLPRYASRDVFKSKPLVFFYALSFFYPLLLMIFIYALHNAKFLELLPIDAGEVKRILDVDGDFFEGFLRSQGFFAFVMTIFIGPGLVSRDLANNGLPLYLARPFSRAEYCLGKLFVLIAILSTMTWVPGLFLFLLQGSYEGMAWITENARYGLAIFVGSWVWILTLGLLALAMSALVRWRPIAAFSMLLIFIAGPSFAGIFGVLFRSDWGHVINLQRLIHITWAGLLGLRLPAGPPLLAAWIALAAFCGLCLLLLNRRIRAYEVIA